MTQLLEPAISSMHYDPDCSLEQAGDVRAHLDRWSQRNGSHVTHLRENERYDYPADVLVESDDYSAGEAAAVRRIFHVVARNVSQSGLCFIAPPVFTPRVLSDATPLLRTATAFNIDQSVTVDLGAYLKQSCRLHGVILRKRLVHLNFWEIAVKFVRRAAT